LYRHAYSTHGNHMTLTYSPQVNACLVTAKHYMSTDSGVDSSSCVPFRAWIHTHTHNRFTALFDFVRDYPGKPKPER